MMKIVLVHKFFYLRGGAEIFFRKTGEILEHRGHQVGYFSSRHPRNPPCPQDRYFSKPPDYLADSLFKRAASLRPLIYSPEAGRRFGLLLDDFQPDLVHAFHLNVHLSPSLLVAAARRGIPVVMSCNDYKHICPNYKLYHHGRICEDCREGRFYRALLNRCCKDSIVFSAAGALEAYVHRFMNIHSRYVDTFTFATDFMARKTEEFWGRGAFRWKKLRNPPAGPAAGEPVQPGDYILYSGRLAEEKGVDILIRAMSGLDDIQLKIFGDGPQGSELRELARRLNLSNVEFLPAVWGKRFTDVLRRCRFLVLPSRWYENLPYAVLRAFSYGKAVIATNRGGIPEVIEDGNTGLLFPASDIRQLGETIKKLWADPDRSVRMGQMGRNYVRNKFNEEEFYSRLITIYREVLGNGK